MSTEPTLNAAPVHPVGYPIFDGSVVAKLEPSDTRWHWARDRQGNLVGVGKFMRPAGDWREWTFWINGTPYSVWQFEFCAAEVPPCIDTVRPCIRDRDPICRDDIGDGSTVFDDRPRPGAVTGIT